MLLTALVIFSLVLFLLMTMVSYDSRGQKNNSLLAFYLSLALFASVTLTSSFPIETKGATSKPAVMAPTRFSQEAPVKYSFYLVVLCAGLYAIRRQDWWDRIIDGIRSWKNGHPEEDSAEALIRHGIKDKKDREWIEKMVSVLSKKDDNQRTKETHGSERTEGSDI